MSMRYKHTGLADDTQTIRSYGPYTTDTDSSASVGLSGLVPSIVGRLIRNQQILQTNPVYRITMLNGMWI